MNKKIKLQRSPIKKNSNQKKLKTTIYDTAFFTIKVGSLVFPNEL